MVEQIPMPAAIERLGRDRHGRPTPWFVHRDEDGAPEFRVIRRGGIIDALRFDWCWVCGQPRGRHAAFVIGPMCALNRVSAEPPSHLPCAIYSALACPFLSTPNMTRRERGLPEGTTEPAGHMIRRNPGVALVWSTRTWSTFRTGPGPADLLFDIGEPTATRWFTEGRDATRAEVLASIDSGLPLLREQAERDGPDAVAALDRMHTAALRLVPTAEVAERPLGTRAREPNDA
jgi:hypothetical protein